MISIKERRIKKELTQEKLAEILLVERSTVAKWESGGSRPRAEKLPDLARALGCSIDDLFSAHGKAG